MTIIWIQYKQILEKYKFLVHLFFTIIWIVSLIYTENESNLNSKLFNVIYIEKTKGCKGRIKEFARRIYRIFIQEFEKLSLKSSKRVKRSPQFKIIYITHSWS